MLHGIKSPASTALSTSPFSWRTAWRSESQLIAARDGSVVARVQQQPDGSGWRAYRVRRATFDGEHVDEREVVVDERVSDGNLRLVMTGLYRDAVEREHACVKVA